METKKTKKIEKFGNEVAHGLGRFHCLPHDLVISILSRIHDLKCLFQCTLVSKGFASKTYCVKSISLMLSAHGMDSPQASTNIFHISQTPSEILEKAKVSPLASPRQELKFLKFLQKFTELECASFESACPNTPCSSPSLNWNVKLGNNGPAVEMIVSVLPTTTCGEVEPGLEVEDTEEDEYEDDEDEYEDDDEQDEYEEDEIDNIDEFPPMEKGCLLFSLLSFAGWFDIMFSLIKHHCALKSVICTDSGKNGKIVLNDEKINEWRLRLLQDELSHNAIPRTITTGWVPFTNLQLPECPRKGASFVFMNFLPLTNQEIYKSWEYSAKKVADTVDGTLTNPTLRFDVWSPLG